MEDNLQNKYKFIKKLGTGAYGSVKKYRDKETKQDVAIKVITFKNEDHFIPQFIYREYTLLSIVNHPNIIKIIKRFKTQNSMAFVFEYLSSDLHSVIYDNEETYLKPEIIKEYLFQILRGVDYLHRNLILHLDLKPANILIDTNNRVKICDFGLANTYTVPPKEQNIHVQTYPYRAPEVSLGDTYYGTPADMWSVGCIFFEMAHGYTLFQGEDEEETFKNLIEIMGTPTSKTWPDVEYLPNYAKCGKNIIGKGLEKCNRRLDAKGMDLLKKMLVMNPYNRIYADEALNHEYFADLDKRKFPIN